MRELLVGCGAERKKHIWTEGNQAFDDLVTLDFNSDHNPDVVWDLNELPYPFKDDEFDEIHAYEVLEHIGTQGDFRHFFAEFEEYWRILKPGGGFYASTPVYDGLWAWSDPGHTRVISNGTLAFLDQREYAKQVGVTPMSDYRFCYHGNFAIRFMEKTEERFFFRLEAIK